MPMMMTLRESLQTAMVWREMVQIVMELRESVPMATVQREMVQMA